MVNIASRTEELRNVKNLSGRITSNQSNDLSLVDTIIMTPCFSQPGVAYLPLMPTMRVTFQHLMRTYIRGYLLLRKLRIKKRRLKNV